MFIGNQWEPEQSSGFVAKNHGRYPVNVSSLPVSVKPPPNPGPSDYFIVSDSRANASVNNITIDFGASGQSIHGKTGVAAVWSLSQDGQQVMFEFVGGDIGWIAMDSLSPDVTQWRWMQVDLADNSTTVYPGPCTLGGFYVEAALSAQDCLIKDDTDTIYTLPASLPAGSEIDLESEDGSAPAITTSLVVDPDNSATGTLLVKYKV